MGRVAELLGRGASESARKWVRQAVDHSTTEEDGVLASSGNVAGGDMSVEQSRRTMHGYFEAMANGQFEQFFTDDVTWTDAESGEVVSGPAAVQIAIIALHNQLSDMRTRQLVVSERAAYIEGDAIGPTSSNQRLLYCVAYDLNEDKITALRAYGLSFHH